VYFRANPASILLIIAHGYYLTTFALRTGLNQIFSHILRALAGKGLRHD